MNESVERPNYRSAVGYLPYTQTQAFSFIKAEKYGECLYALIL